MKTEEEIRESLKREKIVTKDTDYEKWFFMGYEKALKWVLEE